MNELYNWLHIRGVVYRQSFSTQANCLTLSPSCTVQMVVPSQGFNVGKVFPLTELTNSLLMKI